MPENVSKFYAIMTTKFCDASEVDKSFWYWVMANLMPIVSKDWCDRLKDRNAPLGGVDAGVGDREHVLKYLTCSDFAYVPMVVKVYGARELARHEENENNRAKEKTKGRTPGQSGMMKRDNIAKYVDSMVQMKQVLGANNRETVREWSDAVLEYIHGLHANAPPVVVDFQGLADAAGVLAGQELRRRKKDEIEIPV